jgi:hypothetical protein
MELTELILKILGLGVIGLAFLLAYMAYRLLAAEQRRAPVEGEPPRSALLANIRLFMAFSLVLCILVIIAQFWRPITLYWEFVGRGDYGGADFTSTQGSDKPLDSICDRNAIGATSVCWPGGCTYKTVISRAITPSSGSRTGDVYRCTIK